MNSYIFTENALAEIVEYVISYEEKQEGLGTRFMDEVTSAAEEICKMPKAFASYYKSTRERKTKYFPFKLIYTLEGGIVYIHAVFPCKSNPKKKYRNLKK